MLEFEPKYIKSRRGHGCNFIKNITININKSRQKYATCTNLSLFLIIISHPKILKKSAATVVFDRKVSQGSTFKKDSQFSSKFPIAMWFCGYAASQTFLSHLLTLSCRIRWYYDIKLPLFSKIKLNSPFSIQKKSIFPLICKSRFYSLGVSTNIPILDSLLVYLY